MTVFQIRILFINKEYLGGSSMHGSGISKVGCICSGVKLGVIYITELSFALTHIYKIFKCTECIYYYSSYRLYPTIREYEEDKILFGRKCG